MSNYPDGLSMVGSGVYATEVLDEVYCGEVVDGPEDFGEPPLRCTFEGEVEINVNDYGLGVWVCPRCGIEHEWEPEYPDDFEPDEYEDFG